MELRNYINCNYIHETIGLDVAPDRKETSRHLKSVSLSADVIKKHPVKYGQNSKMAAKL